MPASFVQVSATWLGTGEAKQPKRATRSPVRLSHPPDSPNNETFGCTCMPASLSDSLRVSWLHSVHSQLTNISGIRSNKAVLQIPKSFGVFIYACTYSRRDASIYLYAYIVYNLRRIAALFIRKLRWMHTLGKEKARDSQLCFLSFYPFLTASVGSSSLRVTWASSSFFCTLVTRYVIFQRYMTTNWEADMGTEGTLLSFLPRSFSPSSITLPHNEEFVL